MSCSVGWGIVVLGLGVVALNLGVGMWLDSPLNLVVAVVNAFCTGLLVSVLVSS